jgi:hypothetical protein
MVMRILHLFRAPPSPTAVDVARRQAEAGHDVLIVLLLECPELPAVPGLRIERETRPERLHDLLFDHDRVVSW